MNKILEVENLTFKYEEDQEAPTLDGVSFAVQAGEWVSIIGQNGSGKSTTARAIDGLLENVSGNIKIDGQILSSENVWALRQKIGMVFQNPDNQFVGATVEDDVAFGMENQGIPREEMILRVDQALKQVNMLEFKGKEPARLSGGQKQRLCIARALLKHPKVLILDDSTSAVDTATEASIREGLATLKETTKIIIAQRVSSVQHADQIVILDDGHIEAIGTHEELLKNNKIYQDIYYSQMEGAGL